MAAAKEVCVMAALLDFTAEQAKKLQNFSFGSTEDSQVHGLPGGRDSEFDVYDYVKLEEGQLFAQSCLSFAKQSEADETLFLSRKNCGEEMKRRKVDTEFRIGFRTKSEVEIMDDGFKWRKYGKKAVKNSPNPRNYYRCASSSCGVKKRVERDRNDPQYVITIYEGTHNHESPDAGRYPFYPHAFAGGPSPLPSCDRLLPNIALPNLTWNPKLSSSFF